MHRKTSGTQTAEKKPNPPPTLRENPQLRQHKETFFRNFVTKGVSHEMQNSQRFIEADELGVPEAASPSRKSQFGDETNEFILPCLVSNSAPTSRFTSRQPTPREPIARAQLTTSSSQRHAGAIAREVNKRKQFHLGGTVHCSPPFHIDGDDERVRQTSHFSKSLTGFAAALNTVDTSNRGRVSIDEFIKAIQSIEPWIERAHIQEMWRLVDPGGIQGRVPISTLVNVFGRAMATKRSLRGSLGSGNILAWTTQDGDPEVSVGATLGKKYYGMKSSLPNSVKIPPLLDSAPSHLRAPPHTEISIGAFKVPKPPAIQRDDRLKMTKQRDGFLLVEQAREALREDGTGQQRRAGSPTRASQLRRLFHVALCERNVERDKALYSGAAAKFAPTKISQK